MSLIVVLIILAIVGALCWAITTYVPMPRGFKIAIIGVALLVCLLWVASLFGVVGDLRVPRVGR